MFKKLFMYALWGGSFWWASTFVGKPIASEAELPLQYAEGFIGLIGAFLAPSLLLYWLRMSLKRRGQQLHRISNATIQRWYRICYVFAILMAFASACCFSISLSGIHPTGHELNIFGYTYLGSLGNNVLVGLIFLYGATHRRVSVYR